ncbi:MAG: LPXTG cell wall anchor domain-containing protein, partial [Candidatus Aenigmarchaeota archaeon]|nr:LPXTG cell wall anchor domain-containing protein [Candidatus Aenigmarchaeota archaeon]
PKVISAGSNAKIFIGLENLAATLFQNVVVKLDFLGTAFTPIDSASEKRISAIAAGGSSTFFYDIISDPSTESGVYQIPITITYSDTAGNDYTKEGIIGLVVDTSPTLDLNIETRDPIILNKAQGIIFSISNTGPSNVKFLTLHVLSDNNYTTIGRTKEYLGNLDPDDFETAEFTIYPTHPSASGQQDFKILLEYRDAFNNEVHETRTLSVPVYTEADLSEFGLGTNGNSNTTIIVVAVLALAYYLYRRRKKKKA